MSLPSCSSLALVVPGSSGEDLVTRSRLLQKPLYRSTVQIFVLVGDIRLYESDLADIF